MIHDGRSASPIAWLVAISVVLVAALFAPSGARAQAAFTIRNVEVDATAETAAAARERAIADGQRDAFRRLIERLVPAERQKAVPPLGAAEITDLVRDFEVDSEKTSAVRYLATLTIRFKPDQVRALLRRADVPFTETASKPMLVLPLYRAQGALALWDDPNPWREAWANAPPPDGLVPQILPRGDIADIRDIGPDQALNRDPDRLRAIAARYGAAGILLAYATLRIEPQTNLPALDVSATRTGTALPEQTLVQSFRAEQGETVAAMLGVAALSIRRAVEDMWKRDNLLRFDEPHSLIVTVRLTGLSDWIEVRRRLAGIPYVRIGEIKSISREAAVLSLQYYGDAEQLRVAFAQHDLDLAQDDALWVLSQRRAESSAAEPR